MKTNRLIGMAAAGGFLALSGCGGTSPAVQVSCTASQSLSMLVPATNPATMGTVGLDFKIIQAVSFTDPATTGTIASPLSNVKIRIVSPFPDNVSVCPGTCASGAYGTDTKVETDANGILIFMVRLSTTGPTSLTGNLIEVADSQAPSGCNVPITITRG